MEQHDMLTSQEDKRNVVQLCDTYRLLDNQRNQLDQRLVSLTEDDPQRDVVWQELDAVMHRLSGLIACLAATASTQIAELHAKAGITSMVLKEHQADPTSAGATALALSLANEVVHLL